ncbi:unnamed protein product, partial [Didymodactylos carnosus]
VNHNQDGTISHTVLGGVNECTLSDKKLNDPEVVNTIMNLNLPFRPKSMLKSIIIKGIEYNEQCIINVSNEYFPKCPKLGKMIYILSNGPRYLFVYQELKINDYAIP